MSDLFAPPAWMEDAACNDADPRDFFDYANTRAKAICADCPVKAECLAFGIDDEFGIFGGLGPDERRALSPNADPCPRDCGRSFTGKGSMASHLLWCGTDRRDACASCGSRGNHKSECDAPRSIGGHGSTHSPSCRCGEEACRARHAAERKRQRDAARTQLGELNVVTA